MRSEGHRRLRTSFVYWPTSSGVTLWWDTHVRVARPHFLFHFGTPGGLENEAMEPRRILPTAMVRLLKNTPHSVVYLSYEKSRLNLCKVLD